MADGRIGPSFQQVTQGAGQDRLALTSGEVKQLVALAKEGSGSLRLSNGVNLSAADAKAIVALYGRERQQYALSQLVEEKLGRDERITLSSGVELTGRDVRDIMALAEKPGGAALSVGKGGSRITKSEAREAVRSLQTDKFTDQEVATAKAWKDNPRLEFTAGARRIVSNAVAAGPDTIVRARIDPSVSAQAVTYPQYDQMFKDGVFDHMVVIGYDEAGSHLGEQADHERYLRGAGFVPITKATLSADEKRKLESLTPKVTVGEMKAANAQVPGVVRYFVKRFTDKKTGEQVIALQRLVLPVSTTAGKDSAIAKHKEAYIKQHMGQVDAFLYGGHARYGTGPDIDDIHSSAGNVRVAQGYSTKPNAGPIDRVKYGDRYQAVFYNGCRTTDYLKGLGSGQFRKNRDLILTTTVTQWGTTAHDLRAAIDGFMQQSSFNEIISDLDDANGAGTFTARYLKNNTWVPWPEVALKDVGGLEPLFDGTESKLTLPNWKQGSFAKTRVIQQYLNLAMPHIAPMKMDGAASPITYGRIIAFKKAHGLTPADSSITRQFLESLQAVVDQKRKAA